MSIGSWSPDTDSAGSGFVIDSNILEGFIGLSKQSQLENMSKTVPEELQASQAPLMKLGKDVWFDACEHFDSEQLLHLVRFFTRAEMLLNGWEAGADSPVVWIVKILRRRKAPPTKELLLWIKANSDNRFIPNGAL